MADTEVQIVNRALGRIGATLIDAGELATPTRPEGQLGSLEYEGTRDEELRLNAWAFALVRATLTAYAAPATTLTLSLATVGTGRTATAGTDTFVENDVGKVIRVGDGRATITSFTSTTEVVVTITVAFASVGPHASAAWTVYEAAPANTWAYTIPKPEEEDDGSGKLLRVIHVRHRVPYRAEGDHFVSDADSLDLVYVQRVVDTTLFDPDFEEALVQRLAIKFAYGIPGKLELADLMSKLYGAVIERARATGAIEQGQGKYEADPEDVAVATICQEAIDRLGRYPQPAGTDPLDPTELVNRLFPTARDELLKLWPPRFARKRVRLDATITGATGGIVTATVSTAGADYVAGDTITLVGGAVLEVLTVSAGAVATVEVTTPGTGYAAGATAAQSATSGIGAGFVAGIGTTSVTLTPAATTGDAITFTASGAVFTQADVDAGLRILADTGGVARLVGFTSTTVVTADIETDFPDTDAIDAGEWHLAPPWQWSYRYALPSDYLRLTETQCPRAWNASPVTWGWPDTWTLAGEPYSEPAVREGAYLVSNAGPTLDIEYGASITDPSLWDAAWRSALVALLTWRMALPLTGKPPIVELCRLGFEREFTQIRGVDKLDTTRPPKQTNSLVTARW